MRVDRIPDTMTIVHTDDGKVEVHGNGNTVFRTVAPLHAFYLGAYDLAELLRISAGSDAAALEKLAYVMANGHRFRMDDQPDRTVIDNEEPW